jgi:hypothetical protein
MLGNVVRLTGGTMNMSIMSHPIQMTQMLSPSTVCFVKLMTRPLGSFEAKRQLG